MSNQREEPVAAIYHHLVLPPKLPSNNDDGSVTLRLHLGQRLHDACEKLQAHCPDPAGTAWDMLKASLKAARILNQEHLSKSDLQGAFESLSTGYAQEWLILHIAKQNAALLIHRDNGTDRTVFECFAAAAPTERVLEAKHALTWDFPSRTVAIPNSDFDNTSFQESLADFLEQASVEEFDRFAARAKKNGKYVIERRDCASSALISEMLMSMLEGLGSPVEVPSVRKRVRDDVVLDSEIPWRRSAYWLVLRVALRRILAATLGHDGKDRVCFKFTMCAMLADFLHTATGKLHPEQVVMLQAKLSRRLAKLESERSKASGALRDTYDYFFTRTSEDFKALLDYSRHQVSLAWEEYKTKTTRHIPLLPYRAASGDLVLQLPNSRKALLGLLDRSNNPGDDKRSAKSVSLDEGTVLQVKELSTRYAKFVDFEVDAKLQLPFASGPIACESLARKLEDYSHMTEGVYSEDALLMSQRLLLLFELWVSMDLCATEACPLLLQYHPVFVPQSLDVLCLMTNHDMVRLSAVQKHLASRIGSCNPSYGSILDDPNVPTSFQTRFVSSTRKGAAMTVLENEIESASRISGDAKTGELANLMEQYNKLSEEINEHLCRCTRKPDGTKEVKGCTRCWKWRCRKRLKIDIHENFLPEEWRPNGDCQRAAIVFELMIPKFLAAYRSATLTLVKVGTHLSCIPSNKPMLLLKDFEPLHRFWPSSLREGAHITLASSKKSFLQTHYKAQNLPCSRKEVLMTFGPEFSLYDAVNNVWVCDLPKIPWFQRLLGSWLPKAIMDPYREATVTQRTTDQVFPPSSYQIVASASNTPMGMSSREFSAFQRLVSGRCRRWPELLVEFTATNLDHSNEATMSFLNHLALQAGPEGKGSDYLRETHDWFRDEAFCVKLSEQLCGRLDALVSNWREVHCMNIIVTFSLRLYHLCPGNIRENARQLFSKIRKVTSGWIMHLRNEVRSACDADVAQSAANYSLWASLLCRQTFLDAPDEFGEADHESLCYFLRASVALQENILVSLDELAELPKRLLIRDLHMSYSRRKAIEKWVQLDIATLEELINETWVGANPSHQKSFSTWSCMPDPHSGWVVSRTIPTHRVASQAVHYHITQGHLLVDGKPLGRLPMEIRKDPSIRELFGKQHLLTLPSSLAGSQHQVMNEIYQHQIHIGLWNGKVRIQAIFKNRLLEHVPRDIFKSDLVMDLPATLVDDCVHWLNLDTGILEMRRIGGMWSQKSSHWLLDVRNRLCKRNTYDHKNPGVRKPGSSLVEPTSLVGKKIASIFDGFEHVDQVTIYQPAAGPLSLEMKRLEIQFNVNHRGLLVCRQLASEVDPNQDAGTLHGLACHVVLRSLRDTSRRSIIVPIGGSFSAARRGLHSTIRVKNQGLYARFTIDDVLGRLDCAPELPLLYFKAALHAFTSSPLPDKLTSRTGTEEAIHCLTSAESQPWSPLTDLAKSILVLFRSLSPTRQQYPPGTNLYQKVIWNPELSMTIQHERLAPLAEDILRQSQQLGRFWNQPDEEILSIAEDGTMPHLNIRGYIRRQVYEHVADSFDSATLIQAAELAFYVPFDGSTSAEGSRAFRTVKALQGDAEELPRLSDLKVLFKKLQTMGSFKDSAQAKVHEFLDSDTAMIWGSTALLCRKPSFETKHEICFRLAMAAFAGKANMELISWLVALSKEADLREVSPPQNPQFNNYQYDEKPMKESLKPLILHQQPTSQHLLRGASKRRATGSSHPTAFQYDVNQKLEADKLSFLLVAQWPKAPQSADELIDMASRLAIEHLDIKLAWRNLEPELNRLRYSADLSQYLDNLQAAMNQIDSLKFKLDLKDEAISPSQKVAMHSDLVIPYFQVPALGAGLALKTMNASIDELMPQPGTGSDCLPPSTRDDSRLPDEIGILKGIVKSFTSSSNLLRRQYGNDLDESIAGLSRQRHMAPVKLSTPIQDMYSRVSLANEAAKQKMQEIQECMRGGDQILGWLGAGGLLPCMSPVTLLELLRKGQSVSPTMIEALVSYGILITQLQRLRRMDQAARDNDQRWFQREHEHSGHMNWRPLDEPEWLLLEIDGDILIREAQVDVAHSIISPSSSRNSVLQMNMGEGKTSCIMPMAATVLANRTNLCRLVVPRALLMQTAQVMQRRIGRLIGRRVQHVPFARRSPKGNDALSLYRKIHEDTLNSGGVLLTLPEHILSFRLSGLQQLVDNDAATARSMIKIQRWIDASSRDVLDESDLMLSAKTQLIYPGGSPVMVDGHPHRWGVVEEVLSLVEGHCQSLKSQFGNKVQVIRRHNGYPTIQLLSSEAERTLAEMLVQDVCKGFVSHVRLRAPSDEEAQKRLKLIVSGGDVSQATWKSAQKSLVDKTFGIKGLYLLRGLISQGIILLCLKKRWNVQFGLHPARPPIAVPFEAKGVPSETAEYGHPDTALVLTCLAFYQTGLTLSQMTQSLQHIIRSDDPASQYGYWTHGCGALPLELQHVRLLNADDEGQMQTLWRHLRFDTHALNFYMNSFVFPKHAKQFEVKLQASGWDIPLLSSSPEDTSEANLTTGFSGTNDNKRMLPWTIKQNDLPGLIHTNAEVLCYLLEPRNQKCYKAVDHTGHRLTESSLLAFLRILGIRILIDAGAHILEMENHALADEWLKADYGAKGAVYFDRKGQAMVKARFQKYPVPLLASSFADDLSECVVYIDEAHTRGTDLKLPVDATGAVTISMGQTKDQTVQAAMRLRQLGSTQSVAFIAPPEVYHDILELRPVQGPERSRATSVDVVRWLLDQSCKANEDMISLHLAQGFDFCRRTDALWKYEQGGQKRQEADNLLQAILQREDQTLKELYGPNDTASGTRHSQIDAPLLKEFSAALMQQQTETSNGGTSLHPSAMAEVEQEREVEFEVEQIREKQTRVKLTPHHFPGLHPSLLRFAETGVLVPDGPFTQAFAFVGKTSIGLQFGVQETGSRLFVSHEFIKVAIGDGARDGLKLVRPVEWVLWSPGTTTAVIVISEEAELLMPTLRDANQPRVWLLTYAAAVTKSMRIFNKLQYFAIPSEKGCDAVPTWLSIEVGLVAGRLHFDFDEYKPLLTWLGEEEHKTASGDLAKCGAGLATTNRPPIQLKIRQTVRFLLEWLTYRRDSQDIRQTPMGFICQGRPLTDKHSFFTLNAFDESMHNNEPFQGTLKRSSPEILQENDDDSEGDEHDGEWNGDDGADEVD